MKRIKGILKSKRGIALENAILFLIITFSLCALVLTFTIIGRYQSQIERALLEQKVALEQIGEDFLADNLSVFENNPEYKYGDYRYRVEEEGDLETLSVYHSANADKVLLYVEIRVTVENSNRQVNVLKWRYSEPTPQTQETTEATEAATAAIS